MHNHLLTKDELERVLAPTSPHSFKHNISLLAAATDTRTAHEPLLDQSNVTGVRERIQQVIQLVAPLHRDLNNFQVGAAKDLTLLGIAMSLGAIAIEIRTAAAMMGIPLEEVQEALIGAVLSSPPTPDPSVAVAAVNTVIYGVRKPRHPYENIKDE